jgi:uncharacterized membrane protein YidH (DUF202 family)
MDVSNRSKTIEPGNTPPVLRVSLSTGFLALACQLSLNYVLRAHACYVHSRTILHVITGCTLLLTFVGLLLALSALRNLPAEKDEEGGKPYDRAHFQALLAIGFNISFAVAVVAVAIPAWLVQLC